MTGNAARTAVGGVAFVRMRVVGLGAVRPSGAPADAAQGGPAAVGESKVWALDPREPCPRINSHAVKMAGNLPSNHPEKR